MCQFNTRNTRPRIKVGRWTFTRKLTHSQFLGIACILAVLYPIQIKQHFSRAQCHFFRLLDRNDPCLRSYKTATIHHNSKIKNQLCRIVMSVSRLNGMELRGGQPASQNGFLKDEQYNSGDFLSLCSRAMVLVGREGKQDAIALLPV